MRGKMRLVNNLHFGTWLLALLLAAGALALAQTILASSRVVHYTPLHMTVRSTVAGACSGKSLRAARPDAYRCTSGAIAYDPCFKVEAARVACPTDVFTDRGTVVRLTRPLPVFANASALEPEAWAMLLASGARCLRHSNGSANAHPFSCSAARGRAMPIACASPRLQVTGAQAYFVDCVNTGAQTANLGSTLARVIYE